ncbi:MAG: HEPN domain-containing protein [Sulfolobales archaeon]
MLDESEFARWVKSALRTLESARVDHAHGFYSWACFKSHQAAKKALKALLWGLGSPRIGHSLPALLSELGSLLGELPGDIREYCIRLNKYYIPTRYPDVWSEGIPEDQYSEKESLEAIAMAEEILKWVEKTWRLLRKE